MMVPLWAIMILSSTSCKLSFKYIFISFFTEVIYEYKGNTSIYIFYYPTFSLTLIKLKIEAETQSRTVVDIVCGGPSDLVLEEILGRRSSKNGQCHFNTVLSTLTLLKCRIEVNCAFLRKMHQGNNALIVCYLK